MGCRVGLVSVSADGDLSRQNATVVAQGSVASTSTGLRTRCCCNTPRVFNLLGFPDLSRIVGGIAAATRMAAMASPQFTVTVTPAFLDEHSDPANHVYAWSYTVTVVNSGDIAAQLIGRHWVITDATDHVEEVRGLAVVGHQPLLQPGERFEYTSWTRLNTPHGTMEGTFFCMTEAAQWFEAPVPLFVLSHAQALH